MGPEGFHSLRQVFRRIPPDNERIDVDAAAKGSAALHTLRYLLGDELFFEFLRRWAYPDEAMESVTDGGQCRTVDTEDLMAHTAAVAGRNLDWFFDVYVRQPILPKLEWDRLDEMIEIRWVIPEGLEFPMPVEVETPNGRIVAAMEGGSERVPWPYDEDPVVDPDYRVLRHEAPDPNHFGTLGVTGRGVPEFE
jgi:aminopeptidase N